MSDRHWDEVATAMPRREIRFEFPADMPSHWCADTPEFSHVANAFMQALPFLEPYFMHNIREVAERAANPRIKAEIAAYIAQEARHAQEHRRFNAVLRERYPGLAQLESSIKSRLDRSRREDSLAYRMAYTAGYEAITYQMACFLMQRKEVWLARADPRIFGMLIWHMVEEVEHKCVAFDALQLVDPRFSTRVRGLYAAMLMTVKDISVMVQLMLEADGIGRDAASRRRLRQVVLGLVRELAPGFRHYLSPNHHPSHCPDPPLVASWRARYASGADLRVLDPMADLLGSESAPTFSG
jgi:uncharacterized protein